MNERNREIRVNGPDLAALAWCASEIRRSLEEAVDRLSRLPDGTDRDTHLGLARAAIEQASGAMQVADLRGLEPLIDELLEVIGAHHAGREADDPRRARTAARACAAVGVYLDDLLTGEPHQPLRLYPYYRDLLAARGADRIHPADLLPIGAFDDASVAPATLDSGALPDPEPSALAAARGEFERGLLGVLRNSGDHAALDSIHRALSTVRESEPDSRRSLFWDAALACVEGWRSGDPELDVQGKRLLARFNLQMRQSGTLSTPVAERLFAETLFMLAQSNGGSPRARALRERFGLEGAVPPDLDRLRYEVVDAAVFAAIGERTIAAREAWEAAADDPAVAAETCLALAHALARLPIDAASWLAQRVRESSAAASATQGPAADALWQALAGTVLVVQALFERGIRRADSLEQAFRELACELDRIRNRLNEPSASAASIVTGPEARFVEAALSAFVAEARHSIRRIEGVVQAAAAEPTGADSFASAVLLLEELAGAVAAMGHDAGADEVSALAARLSSLRETVPGEPLRRDLLDTLAIRLGAIGLFIDSLVSPLAVQAPLLAFDDADLQPPSMASGEAPETPDGVVTVAEPLSVDGEDRIRVGEADLARAAYDAFLSEADGLLGMLGDDAQSWARLPSRAPSAEARDAMRALERGAREVSLDSVSAIAAQLGAFLGDRLASGHGAGPEEIADYSRVLDRLRALLHQFAAGAIPRDEPAALALARRLATRVQARAPAADPALDPDLLPEFIDEAADLLPRIGEALDRLGQDPSDRSSLEQLTRWLHTIKGSARMIGALDLGERAHAMESRLGAHAADDSLPRSLIDSLRVEHDEVMRLFDQVRSPAEPAEAGVAPVMLRVRADLLDSLVNESGEAAIARSRLDNELAQMRLSLRELGDDVSRLRSHLREMDLQPEASAGSRGGRSSDRGRDGRLQQMPRMLAESVDDIATLQAAAVRSLDQALQDLAHQGQVLREIQQNVMRMRRLRFGSLSDRLRRTVRLSAAELGKSVQLGIGGEAVEIDRGILEAVCAPIEHLLRNAVAHGIEAPAARVSAGKGETGAIRLEARHDGTEVIIVIADDGAGLDMPRILDKARRLGLVDAEQTLSDQEAVELVFVPGFSTADAIDSISGRGVGLDVVRSEIAMLGGSIETESRPGAGVSFTLRLPITLAIAQVVLLDAGGSRVAVPASMVEQVLQLRPQDLAQVRSTGCIDWQGMKLALHDLAGLIEADEGHAMPQSSLSPVIVLRSANQRIAVCVQAVSPAQEVVVKKAGVQAQSVPGVTGATVLGSGEIVLIVNPVRLAQAVLGEAWSQHQPGRLQALAGVPSGRAPLVMVIDDSITVRKVTQRLLEREGYRVALARDGVDAIRVLEETTPDLVLTDLEMPRMDGLGLIRRLRGDDRCRSVPVVMISSRNSDPHRLEAEAAGANRFIGKPWREDELLSTIRELLARDRDD